MIFIGDVSIPHGVLPQAEEAARVFAGAPVVADVEGVLLEREGQDAPADVIYNTAAALEYLTALNTRVATLANNHTTDIARLVPETLVALKSHGIETCGAGAARAEAAEPALLHGPDGGTVAFLGFGWEAIGCRAARRGSPGVNPLRPDHVLRSLSDVQSRFPDARVVLLMHWNYELEAYPQPMHRELAFRAVEEGASAVVGCHSHCVQGLEVHRGAPIAYGLGNWFVPEGIFLGGMVKYPAWSHRQLAFEWEPESSLMRCHWFNYQPDGHALVHETSEPLSGSRTVEELTPFDGMAHREYVRWFRANRRKRFLLPAYNHLNTPLTNSVKDHWVRIRQQMISLLVNSGITWRLT